MDRVRSRCAGSMMRWLALTWTLVGWPLPAVLAQFPAFNHGQGTASVAPGSAPAPFGAGAVAPPSDSALPPPAAPVELAPEYLVADVRIVGNDAVAVDKILQLIRTRKGRTFDPELLQQDKRNLLTHGLFRHVNVTTQNTNYGVLVTFEVFERPTIHFIRFLGDRGINEKSLLRECGLKVGDALNIYAIEEGRRRIEELYRRKGYPKIQVTVAEGTRPEDRGVAYIIGEGPRQRIWAVTFTGNDESVVTAGRLKTQIESKPGFLKVFGGTVDHEKIAADIEKLTLYYRGLGYFGARVGRRIEYDDQNKWLTINYIIDEGPRYVVRDISVLGNQKFATEQVREQLQLQPGGYFNLDRMNAGTNAMQDLYGSQGYIFAKIDADLRFHEEPGELDVVYSIAEGEQFRVGRINVKIAGEFPHTKESVILDRLSIRPGQIVDIREVRNSERRLRASQLFIVNPAEGEPPRIVLLPPDLKDAERLAVSAEGTQRGQNPDERPVIDLEVQLPKSFQWFK